MLQKSSAHIIAWFDHAQGLVSLNLGVQPIAGLPAEDFLGRIVRDLHGEAEFAARFRENLDQVFLTHEPTTFAFEVASAAGTRSFEVTLVPGALAGGEAEAVLGVIQDITDRQRLEALVQRAQKTEILGRLASGMIHDFNNLLTVIQGYGEVLDSHLGADPSGRAVLQQVLRAAEQASLLTHQLLAFGRQQALTPFAQDLNAVVDELDGILHRLIGDQIRLITSLEPALGAVRAGPGQLEQVILNLVMNARDAMPRGGQLYLETRNLVVGPAYRGAPADLSWGPYVVLTVRDTGGGMDEATRRRLFEPFFTTKGPGRGTGLGLATVEGIVRGNGGVIDVTSELGHGTTFHVYLPRTAESAGPRSQEQGPTAARGSETVLVVEDDAAVRNLVRLALQAQGYTVLEASHGEEALDLVRTPVRPIELLVTDAVLPRMNGRQLADLLIRARPNMKVLYLSGYPIETLIQFGILETGTAFLAKPFLPADLVRKVREILGT